MDALIVAGGTPAPTDPLYPDCRGRPKSLLDVGGRPMVQWVLDAVAGSARIDRILVVGLGEEDGLQSSKPLLYLAEQGSLIGNLRAGMAYASSHDPSADHLLMATSDIPLITSEMVSFRAEQIQQGGADLDYCAIERSIMQARFPDSRRSYIHLKDIEACGGDIHGVRLALNWDDALWDRLIAARKNALKQAYLLGLDTALMLLLRQASVPWAEEKISRRLHLRARVQVCPYAEVGMDVDKPFQLQIVRREIQALTR